MKAVTALLSILKRHPWLSSLAILLSLYIVGLGIFTPIFETNDDTAMMGIVSGITYGQPSPHILFSNVLVGLALTKLYGFHPSTPWYGIYLYTFQALAIFTIIRLLISILSPFSSRGLILIVITSAALLPLIVSLQFTSTAILIGVSGMLLHGTALKSVGGRARWYQHILAGLLVGLAALIRTTSAYAAVLFALPVVLFCMRKERNVVIQTSLFFLVTIIAWGGPVLLQEQYYRNLPEWKKFSRFNEARGALHGNARLIPFNENPSLYRSIDWSANDRDMFKLWFFTDAKRYSRDKLQKIIDSAPRFRTNMGTLDACAAIWSQWRMHIALVISTVISLSVIMHGWHRLFPFIYVTYVGLTLFYLILFERLPNRVALPVLITTLLCVVFFVFYVCKEYSARQRRISAVSLALALFFTGAIIHNLSADSSMNSCRQLALQTRLENLQKFGSDAVFVLWSGDMQLHSMNPLRIPHDDLRSLNFVGLGWRTHSPDFSDHIARLHLEDLYKDIALKDKIYLISGHGRIPYYNRYLREHYGLDGTIKSIGALRGDVCIYSGFAPRS